MASEMIFAKPYEKAMIKFLAKLDEAVARRAIKEVTFYLSKDNKELNIDPENIMNYYYGVAIRQDEHCYYVLALKDEDHYNRLINQEKND